ncbi:tRNA (N(6)-L-threonylcarbamoyladenosine(37)-C(2))-methylthiotransferase MtaB [Dorea acetigenes]|uniref:tRNA (N(6)-L-threonylcarbamoyladenosine(37)-C(2))-methylthiotransferase MtaB n=1 Tax=Dorea acetigenes TaxID=2981787 RepID=A0ABT2RKS1_9FIRM|nr:tRNA (N(6)-L-threonylcarbamoyladenosine(37)-C(2))-methylthiotransferase MtaB [Dorea acetigenes]MCB6415886.1 tRNA (N(6)-L-threonylcarbamoyladenosine(37)-C(2))-methylthiotransferase MtaB [Faecalimonas umbilicata]MCU6685774.1 tRNA (N(6)-L-threonylcarbamoyladenosine(37)-C(2))-methylthiotransferase MtaB [Dorea acetigenes]SCI62513.1 (Dimethylallyl)adenosine tRNA methylthiotransferase MiaB [uncultured Clostridium sp.]
MKKAALHNLGCKVNAYETEAMQELLEQSGYEIVPFEEGADVYIVNTCTVTNMADRKSRQILHRARKMNPDAVVVAAGCYVQAKAENIDDSIDIVIGNNKKQDLIQILDEYWRKKAEDRQVSREILDIGHTAEYESLHLSKTAEHTRAYIKVQDGCNQFCSYCIIPYARGRVRSRAREEVVREVETLAENGYKEVVLTGIHLSSYGIERGDNLLSLILAVHEVAGIQRIRLGSLEPRIITEEFVKTIAGLPKICPHFHLSLQSGCNATLKRMNRKYTAEEYFEKCELLRMYFSDPALTTDVIVGFPGETEEEFAQSRAFVDKVNFYETHIFKYSKRAGTKAAEMKNQVPEEIKAARSSELLALGRQKERAYEEKLIGRTVEVLIEERAEREDGIYQVGHTKEYVKIGLKTSENLENQLINVEIENRLQIIH